MSRQLGIYRHNSGWNVDKVVHGHRLRERFGSERDAKEWLAQKTVEMDRIVRFGETPKLTFEEAVIRRLREKVAAGQPSAESESYHLRALLPFVGSLQLTTQASMSSEFIASGSASPRRRFICPCRQHRPS